VRTPDIEGVAIHDGPESCIGVCEGVGEALTGTCRPAVEPRNHSFGVPTSSHETEGHITGGVSASRRSVDPARSENLGMYGVLPREDWEIPMLACLVDHQAGRLSTARENWIWPTFRDRVGPIVMR
jgi:hypothetical protein